jgi:cytoskeletal protein CcmA (bactofilin family)
MPSASAARGAGAPFSILAADITITGNVSASADLHIDGTVEGDISCATLAQGRDSRIIGHVKARAARIGGLVDGSIDAGELVVESTARITGDVTYETISIAAGGQVAGRFAHKAPAGAELKLVGG